MAKNALKTVTKADQAMVETLFRTGSLPETAKALGISEQEIRVSVTKPNIRDMLILEYTHILMLDLMPLAVGNLKRMLNGEAKTDRNMVALCKLILDQVGQPMAGHERDAKPLQDMTIAELQAFIAEKEKALPDITPRAQQHDPQLIDYLD